MTISSPQNTRIKQIRGLIARRRARRQSRRCALEGLRLVGDALDAGSDQFDYILFTPDLAGQEAGAALLAQAQAADIDCLEIAPDLAPVLADTETPQGIWAVCRWPDPPAQPGLILLLDQIRDPGNLGTMLRTAGAAGVGRVILTKGTVDPFNPKVLRAGMGAHFRVPVGFEDETPDSPLVLADARGEVRYDLFDWTRPVVTLAIGGETTGFSEMVQHHAETRVYIPMARATESLNAATAAAVILFEARRQRTI